MNKILWVLAFFMLLAGGALVFYFGAPEGALERLKDKTAALFSKENPPLAVEPKKDKADEDSKDDIGASSDKGQGDGASGENPQAAEEDVDLALPTGLPELPPVDLGSESDSENGTKNSDEKGDSDDFFVEIVSPDDTQ